MPDEAAPLGDRPPEDALELDVAQARVAARLFGVEREVAVGRYKLLELVGRGGMGVVWGAWDPELERKVAVKLVDQLRPTARDRIVAEARALAKLSHPNVVPVYDVGVVDDRVYLVMEWVVGENLRAHLAQKRAVAHVVDVYAQAARGLAAVHAAGLVHRDFKPENAMIGRDDRVRVLDFGLARADVDDGARAEVAGTPRYMAPEQLAGATPTPAVDQFALCTALRESLDALGEPPRWLAAICARGTAAVPADRFASMDELVRALGRDPARVLRRRVLAGAALAATAAAFAIGRAADDEACTTAPPPAIAPGALARIGAHLDQLGPFAAGQRPALLAVLDEHQRGWTAAHRAACVAHDRGALTTRLYERRLTCLARAAASLAGTAEILEHATAESFPDARVAAGALVDPSLCARVDESLVPPPPAADEARVRTAAAAVERARIFATAARSDAEQVATAARTTAEATGYAPVLARALLVEGRAQMLVAADRARGTLDRAMRVAFAARDDATAVEAFARAAYVAARYQDQAIDGTTVIEAVAEGLGSDDTFERLLLLNNLAVVRQSNTDDRTAARALLERAMRDWRPGQGEDEYELASIPQNLALAVDEPARSVTLLAQAQDEIARTLGADHPKAIEIARARALFLDLPAARALHDDACVRLARLFPQLVGDRTMCEYEAAWLADDAGDAAAAAAHFAATVFPADEPLRAQIAASMRELEAEPAKTAETLERAATAVAKDAVPWLRIAAADAYVAAARGWETARDPVAAARCWERAVALYAGFGHPYVARLLARARAGRALAVRDAAAAPHAEAALAWYRAVGGYADRVAALARER
jgi:hypothetical protein